MSSPPDQPGAERAPSDVLSDPGGPTTSRGWRPSWVTAAVVVVALAAGGFGYVKWDNRPQAPKWCAGVGLFGPPAGTPRAALEAWLASDGGQPRSSSWRQDGDSFVNRAYTADHRHGLQSVTVERGGPRSIPWPLPADTWTVQGGCV